MTPALWNPHQATTVARKGEKVVKIAVNDEKKMSTVMLSTRVLVDWKDGVPTMRHGHHRKPLIIFRGTPSMLQDNPIEKEAKRLSEQGQVDAAVTTNGWMDGPTMVKWVQKLDAVPAGTGWLVMDLFAAHRTPAVLNAAKQRGYTVLFIPAGMTGLLQFHDVIINKTFKQRLVHAYAQWAAAYHAHQRPVPQVSRAKLAEWVHAATFDAKDSDETIYNGIAKCVTKFIATDPAEREAAVARIARDAEAEVEVAPGIATVDEIIEMVERVGLDEEDTASECCCYCGKDLDDVLLRECERENCKYVFHHMCETDFAKFDEEQQGYCKVCVSKR